MVQGILYPFLVYLLSLQNSANSEYSPSAMLYAPYIADTRAPRMSLTYTHVPEPKIINASEYRFDFTLGTYAKLTRIKYKHFTLQSDIGASFSTQSDMKHSADVIGFDGVIDSGITFRFSKWFAFRFGYKHLSAHRGDEYLIRLNSFERINYTRDENTFAFDYYFNDFLRSYFEVGLRINRSNRHPDLYTSDNARYQIGLEYQPLTSGPFAAIDVQIAKEWRNRPNFNIMTGLALIDNANKKVYRIAFEYYTGITKLREFAHLREEMLSIGFWLDL